MKTRLWHGCKYYYWNINNTSDLFVEIQPNGLIRIGDRSDTITPEEFKDLHWTMSEVVQFLQEQTIVTRKESKM